MPVTHFLKKNCFRSTWVVFKESLNYFYINFILRDNNNNNKVTIIASPHRPSTKLGNYQVWTPSILIYINPQHQH